MPTTEPDAPTSSPASIETSPAPQPRSRTLMPRSMPALRSRRSVVVPMIAAWLIRRRISACECPRIYVASSLQLAPALRYRCEFDWDTRDVHHAGSPWLVRQPGQWRRRVTEEFPPSVNRTTSVAPGAGSACHAAASMIADVDHPRDPMRR